MSSKLSGLYRGHKNPAYEDVCSKKTGHCEAVQITFNPQEISYEELLEIYWRQMNPTDRRSVFDRGEPYQTAIFIIVRAKEQAETSKKLWQKAAGCGSITTRILPANRFSCGGIPQVILEKSCITRTIS